MEVLREKWPFRPNLRSARVILAAVAAMMIFPLFGFVFPAHFGASSSCAPRGDHQRLQLEDGTTIELNSGSCLTLNFSTTTRLAYLDSGEAIFQVAHDPNRPFIVETGRLSIWDLGTRFDVYARGDRGTRVSVLEGTVWIAPASLSAGESSISLTSGQEVDIPRDSEKVSVPRHITSRDFERMTAWVDGLIEFYDQSLEEVLAEFERYQAFSVSNTDPQILKLRMGGSFRTTDLAPFLESLRAMCIHAAYDKAARTITLTRMAGKQHTGCL